MSPAIWDDAAFKESGFKSIKKFVSTVDNIEDDVEGDYGVQIQVVHRDTELLEAAEGVEIEDGVFTTWVKQSSNAGSLNQKWVADIKAFCRANDIEWAGPSSLIGRRLEWQKKEYPFGKDMNPGTAYVPTQVMDGKSTAAKGKAKAKPKESAPNNSVDLDAAIIAHVQESGGTTHALLKKYVAGEAALRNALKAAEQKFDDYAQSLVDSGKLSLNDGVYTASTEESSNDDEDI